MVSHVPDTAPRRRGAGPVDTTAPSVESSPAEESHSGRTQAPTAPGSSQVPTLGKQPAAEPTGTAPEVPGQTESLSQTLDLTPAASSAGERTRTRSRFSRRIPRLTMRVIDALVILSVCLLTGLANPWGTALGIVLVLQLVPGFYRFRMRISLLDELPRLLLTSGLSTFLIADVCNPLSSHGAATVTVLTTGGLVLSWGVASVFTRFRRTRNPEALERTLLLGSVQTARDLGRYLREHPNYGLRPVAMVDREIEPGAEQDGLDLDRLDDNLRELIRRHQVSVVIVAFTRYSDEHLLSVLRSCVREDAEFYIVPRLSDRRGDHSTELLGTLALRHIPRAAHRSLGWFSKRPFDILISGTALVLLSPLLLALALAVKLNCRTAPILFRQERVGLDGKRFNVLKFRSLLPVDKAESDSHWNISGDKRLTRLGSMMRRYSLDELPQIYNVFRGDMSLVGPRPERPYFVDKFAEEYPGYVDRHRVPVGLTGWAAINGLRGDTSIRDRVLYDNWYIENWSPWLDIKVMVLTVRAVVGGSGG